MAINFGSKIEGTAYAVLNEIFGVFRGKGGFARPSRYEIIITIINSKTILNAYLLRLLIFSKTINVKIQVYQN